MARVVVWPVREVAGWKGTNNDDVEAYPVTEILEALTAHYSTDAHFCPLLVREEGQVPDALPRINQTALGVLKDSGAEVLYESICVDVDHNESHSDSTDTYEAPNLWWIDQKRSFQELACCASAGYYRTRRGYRLIWRLNGQLGIEQYLEVLSRLRATISPALGPTARVDPLHDFNRSYRLPFVMRDGVFEDREANFDNMMAATLDVSTLVDISSNPLAGISKAQTFTRRDPVPDGDITANRNVTLTRIAGKAVRAGLEGYDQLFPYLCLINQQKCKPPLDESEVSRIAESAGQWEAPEEHIPAVREDPSIKPSQRKTLEQIVSSPAGLKLGSQPEIAEKVLETLEGKGPRIVFDRGNLFQYTPEVGIWRQIRPEEIRKLVHAMDGVGVNTGTNKDGSMRITPLKITHRWAEDILAIIRDQRAKPGFFDKNTRGVAFRNGFFSPPLGFLEHSPDNRTTFCLPFDYEKDLKPTMFLRFLQECFAYDVMDMDERVQVLREFFGIALCGMSTVYQQALLLVGSGANGKSVLLETISKLFPSGTITAIPPHEMDKPHNKARLAGARINLVTELQEADILSSEAFKAVVDGSVMEAAEKYGHPFSFRPTCGHVFAANNLPGARDTSKGFFRRWILIDWKRTFEGAERDPWLKEKLEKELREIACWLADGAAEAFARGCFLQVRSLERLKNEWHRIADPFTLFLEQRTVSESIDNGVTSKELFDEYRSWCRRTGHMAMANAGFLRKVAASGIETQKNKTGPTKYGLKIVEGNM